MSSLKSAPDTVSKPTVSMPTVIAVFNQKGGISKTTTATNLALCLSAFGARVAVIDLDAQGDSTKHLCLETRFTNGIYELFMGEIDLIAALHPTRFENIRIVPSTYDLAGIEVQLAGLLSRTDDWQTLLRRALAAAGPTIEVDYVVIDCPPGLGFLPVNALAAADAVLIPVTATPLAYDGLMRTLPIVDYIRGRFNKTLMLHGILLTLVGREMVGRKTVARLKENFAKDMYKAEVPLDDAVVEASGHRLPVTVFAPKSKAAQSYLTMTAEFIERQDLIKRRAAGVSGMPAKRPMAELKAQAQSALSALHAAIGQLDRDPDTLAENKRALREKLSTGDGLSQRFHFWLVNAAIYYRTAFFLTLILGLGLSLVGFGALVLWLFPPP